MEEYSGNVIVRMPKELHKRLALKAKQNNVSLNVYIVYLLTASETYLSQGTPMPSFVKMDLKLEDVKERMVMSQDKNSGRRGNEVGRLIGEAVAKRLNISLEPGSNKGKIGDKLVVIKSARIGNPQFGITNKMAEEIDEIILAKEKTQGVFELYKVEFNKIKDTGKPTRSKGASMGKVTNYRVSEVVNCGTKFDIIEIKLPYPPNSRI